MKVLRYFPDGPSAQVAKSFLATHGIEVFVGDPPDAFSVKGVRLMVPEDQETKAKALLAHSSEELALPDNWVPPTDEADDPAE